MSRGSFGLNTPHVCRATPDHTNNNDFNHNFTNYWTYPLGLVSWRSTPMCTRTQQPHPYTITVPFQQKECENLTCHQNLFTVHRGNLHSPHFPNTQTAALANLLRHQTWQQGQLKCCSLFQVSSLITNNNNVVFGPVANLCWQPLDSDLSYCDSLGFAPLRSTATKKGVSSNKGTCKIGLVKRREMKIILLRKCPFKMMLQNQSCKVFFTFKIENNIF